MNSSHLNLKKENWKEHSGLANIVAKSSPMLAFNEKGLLVPNQPILSDLEEIRKVFTQEIASPRRTELFENYLRYLEDLKALIGEEFYQWINGSFVSKKLIPQDIDLVVFAPWQLVNKFDKELKELKSPLSLKTYGVDAYFVKVYEEHHRDYFLFLSDKAHWLDFFGKTREDRNHHTFKKGFLEVKS